LCRRAEKQQQTRTALLRSAAKTFAEGGYHATTVDEVAETAGYSVGALYSNFATKQDLLHATAERYVAEQVESWASSFDSANSPEAQIGAPGRRSHGLTQSGSNRVPTVRPLGLRRSQPEMRARFATGRDASKTFSPKQLTKPPPTPAWRSPTLALKTSPPCSTHSASASALRKLIDLATVPDDLFARLLNDLIPPLLNAWATDGASSRGD